MVIAIAAFAASAGAAEPVYVVEVPVVTDGDLQDFADRGWNIGNVTADTATLYLSPMQVWDLDASGYPYAVVDVQEATALKGSNNGTGLGEYVSFETMTQMLQDYAAMYPDICRLESLGTSVEGRTLWHVRITDNPAMEEAEPEFKYVGNMHGDEAVAVVMLLFLVDHLLTNYDSDSRITSLVDETDISIVPLMNPDGYEAITRANANGVDLNRNFPQHFQDFTGSIFDGVSLMADGRQPETASVMEWSAGNSFVLSANLHTGALVVNYPLDFLPGVPSGQNAASDDDGLFIGLSLEYSTANGPMFNGAFPQGITNGSDWFAIMGGMQDWNYFYLSCFEVTLELSNIKRPFESTLPGFWEDNRESLVRYMEAVHRGVRGVVTAADTGGPVYARVTVSSGGRDVFTDPDVGDYYRLLLPGTYDLAFAAPGYATQTAEDVTVSEGVVTMLDVQLNPSGSPEDVNGDNAINAIDVQLVINGALGLDTGTAEPDVNGDGVINAIDVQLVINAALR